MYYTGQTRQHFLKEEEEEEEDTFI